jgi:hypothetical protein
MQYALFIFVIAFSSQQKKVNHQECGVYCFIIPSRILSQFNLT